MKTRSTVVDRAARPDWDWDGLAPTTALAWAALSLVALHVLTLVAMQALHPAYRAAGALWDDPHVAAAAAVYAVSAIGAAGLALYATLRQAEHSILMLVPVLLGAFWAFWLLAGLPGWLS